jgi:hypothetical protein
VWDSGIGLVQWLVRVRRQMKSQTLSPAIDSVASILFSRDRRKIIELGEVFFFFPTSSFCRPLTINPGAGTGILSIALCGFRCFAALPADAEDAEEVEADEIILTDLRMSHFRLNL